MSVHITVFLRPTALPSFDVWQTGIAELNVDLDLDRFNPGSDYGWRPASYQGQPSGFEFYLEPDPAFDFTPAPALGDRTLAADFVVKGELRSLVCAFFAAAALATIADGVFLDEDTGRLVDADRLLADARGAAASLH